ncbi:MAG: Arc family DNA-binding protein [Oscillibacter sp.]|nr:Arc family DNA-binding protein [Oscillibacter sp.]
MAFTLRVYRDGVAKLDYIASANGRSRNSEINQAIKLYIAQYERTEGKITPEDLQAWQEEAGE